MIKFDKNKVVELNGTPKQLLADYGVITTRLAEELGKFMSKDVVAQVMAHILKDALDIVGMSKEELKQKMEANNENGKY